MRSAAPLLWSIAGLLGWAVAFTLVYALHGIGCARGWHEVAAAGTSLQRTVLAGAWIGSLLVMAWLAWRVHRMSAGEPPEARLLARVARSSAWAGLAGTVFTLYMVLGASACL